MDVMAFIFESTQKALKIDAAHRAVDDAKAAVEAARAAVEAAKAGVETAKLGVVAAKEELDSWSEQAEGFGLTKAKFKDAVERMKSLMGDVGAVAAPQGEATVPAAPVEQGEPKVRTPRKKKATEDEASTAPEAAHGEVQAFAAFPSEGEGEAALSVAEVAQDEAAASVGSVLASNGFLSDEARVAAILAVSDASDEADQAVAAEPEAVVEEKPASAIDEEPAAPVEDVAEEPTEEVEEEAVAEESASEEDAEEEPVEDEDEIDNELPAAELEELVTEIATDADVVKVLHSAIKLARWHADTVTKTVLRTSPSPLTAAVIAAAEDHAYLPANVAPHLAAVNAKSEKIEELLSWFAKALELASENKAGSIVQFTFAEPKPAAVKPVTASAPPFVKPKAAEPAAEAVAPVAATAPEPSLGEGMSSETGYAETIDDLELFAETPAQAAEEAKEEPAPAPAAAPVAAAPVKVTKPAWLTK